MHPFPQIHGLYQEAPAAFYFRHVIPVNGLINIEWFINSEFQVQIATGNNFPVNTNPKWEHVSNTHISIMYFTIQLLISCSIIFLMKFYTKNYD